MAGFETRLNTLSKLENTACGFEENLIKADRQRDRLLKYLETEIERLVQGGAK